MFCHPAWAVGSYCSGPPAAGTAGTKSTGGFTEQMDHPVYIWQPWRFLNRAPDLQHERGEQLGRRVRQALGLRRKPVSCQYSVIIWSVKPPVDLDLITLPATAAAHCPGMMANIANPSRWKALT